MVFFHLGDSNLLFGDRHMAGSVSNDFERSDIALEGSPSSTCAQWAAASSFIPARTSCFTFHRRTALLTLLSREIKVGNSSHDVLNLSGQLCGNLTANLLSIATAGKRQFLYVFSIHWAT
jgi:hypothetical protein